MPAQSSDAVLETPRLRLRHYREDDGVALFAILGDPVTMAMWPAPFTREGVAAWIARNRDRYRANGFGRYAVCDRADDALIGDCGIVPAEMAGRSVYDLGYIVHHSRWGRGLALEAARAVMTFAFETLGLPALHANMAEDHHASRRLAERLGMTVVDTFVNPRNRNRTTLLYARYR